MDFVFTYVIEMISLEADRVLKKEGWTIIQDFFAESPIQSEYCHIPGIKSYKMDYKAFLHGIQITHVTKLKPVITKIKFSDSSNEWVETSVIRRKIHNV